MPKLTCTSCQLYLPDFCAGRLGWRRKRQVTTHLRRCDRCLQLAEREKSKRMRTTQAASHLGPRPGKGQAVAKWGAVFFVFMLGASLLFFAYDTYTHEQREAQLRTWVELRFPRGKLGKPSIDWTGWLPYYRHEIHYPLLRSSDRRGSRRLGTVTVSHVLWQRTIEVSFNHPVSWPMLRIPDQGAENAQRPSILGESDSDSDLSRKESRQQGQRTDTHVWTALEQLPPSVTVDMAFSTRHFSTPRAMAEMLAPYDVQLLGMYVFGEETLGERRQIPPLELVLWTQQSGAGRLKDSEHALMEKLRIISQDPVKLQERELWQKRLAYIQEHGLRAYGAAVRGSPQDLLRLREILQLREPVLMEIDWALATS